MDYKQYFLIFTIVFFTIFTLGCEKEKLRIKNVIVINEGFLVEMEGDSKSCFNIDQFIFAPSHQLNGGISFQKYGQSEYVETQLINSGAKFILNYKKMIQDGYLLELDFADPAYRDSVHLKFNQEYNLTIEYERNAIFAKIYIENKVDKLTNAFNFEEINPSDYEVILLEQEILFGGY